MLMKPTLSWPHPKLTISDLGKSVDVDKLAEIPSIETSTAWCSLSGLPWDYIQLDPGLEFRLPGFQV